MSHTPTPWKQELNGYHITATNPLGHTSIIVHSLTGYYDAAHIVHCVNSHDELVRQRDELRAALTKLIDHLILNDTQQTAQLEDEFKNVLNSCK